MSRFYVHLRHPDGSLRVLVREHRKGTLVVTTIGTRGGWTVALFVNPTQAQGETQAFLEERRACACARARTFPKYEIIVLHNTV